jgi:FKBP-type peptidyl-prolyl cis-trans isomerase
VTVVGRRARLLGLVGVPLLAVALVGCTDDAAPDPSTGTPGSTPAATACLGGGAEADSVEVSGEVGQKPTVTLPSPLGAATSQRAVVTPGTGPETASGDVVQVAVTVFDATTGAELSSAGYERGSGEQLTISADYYVPGLEAALLCNQAGSRSVTVASAADMQPAQTGTAPPNAAAVIVVDTFSIVPTRATGVDQPAQPGLPEVTLADDGRPTVTIPDADPPAELQIAVLKKGDGEVVPDPANVTVQYQGVNWRDGKVFDESWGKGTPTPFSTAQVVPGFAAAMIGQTVGSQVLVVVPPAEGYGDGGQPSAGIEGGDTLVFVIDVLAVA